MPPPVLPPPSLLLPPPLPLPLPPDHPSVCSCLLVLPEFENGES
ncbi:unnamed protein product [Spirodela intermedia]|uniref:Uncharacterized protein n=1 Tax=Spirodela intermedia TaxID=51605 RepID=A0ABN7ECC0_SPIIN|nr:unnamed protein product [Spirodela intermedia]